MQRRYCTYPKEGEILPCEEYPWALVQTQLAKDGLGIFVVQIGELCWSCAMFSLDLLHTAISKTACEDDVGEYATDHEIWKHCGKDVMMCNVIASFGSEPQPFYKYGVQLLQR